MISYEDYLKICKLIDEAVETDWVSANYQRHFISMSGASRLKEKIKDRLVEDNRNARNK